MVLAWRPCPTALFAICSKYQTSDILGRRFLSALYSFLSTHVHVKTARTGFFASMNDTDPSAANIDSTVKPSR